MRNYIRKKGKYSLNKSTYMQMVYLIRDYKELIDQRDDILYGSPPPPDGLPKGNDLSNPTEQKGLALDEINRRLKAVDQTIIELKAKYEDTYTGEEFDPHEAFKDYGVFCYYRSKKTKDIAPTSKTWSRYRSEFAYKVAKKLNLF